MRKYLIFVFSFSLVLASCKNSNEKKVETSVKEMAVQPETNKPKETFETRKSFIDKEVSLIDSNVNTLRKVEFMDVPLFNDFDSVNYSSEAMSVRALCVIHLYKFYDSLELKKIITVVPSPYNPLTSEYYLNGENLIFNRKTFTVFNEGRPYHYTTKTKYQNYEFYVLNDNVYPKAENLEWGYLHYDKIVLKDFKVYFEYSENE